MLYRIFKGTSIALATSLILATMANSAQAVIRQLGIEGFTDPAGDYIVDWIVRVEDSNPPPLPRNLTPVDIVEYTVQVQDFSDPGNPTTFSLIGGNGLAIGTPTVFGTVNSSILTFPTAGLTFDSSSQFTIDAPDNPFTPPVEGTLVGELCISAGQACTNLPTTGSAFFGANIFGAGFLPQAFVSNSAANIQFLNPPLPAQATPVPFEVSPNLALIALGGIWGVSRLRKRQKASKLISEE